MRRLISNRTAHLFVASLLLPILLAACPPVTQPSEEDLLAAFDAAVADAQDPQPAEICRDLTAITKYTPDLVWEGEPGGSRVKMVTWTSYSGYVVGKSYTARYDGKYQPAVDLWVTAAPEVQNWVQQHPLLNTGNAELRLKQLLGMPHTTNRVWFVEFWVEPQDLFRPSPDPEVTDHEAELDFPLDNDAMQISQEHKEWVQWQIENNDWPWTRLGYTYDWGNSCSHVGLSEFVIKNNAVITVISITPTMEYLFG